jgi:DNA-binding PadR family transcriptional regulator
MVQPSRWRHGYELSRQTGLKSGTLYPILMRLSDRELLESRWRETPETGRPPRHLYRLTAAGRAYAATELADADAAGLTTSNAPA